MQRGVVGSDVVHECRSSPAHAGALRDSLPSTLPSPGCCVACTQADPLARPPPHGPLPVGPSCVALRTPLARYSIVKELNARRFLKGSFGARNELSNRAFAVLPLT